jgi:Permease family
MPNAMTSGLYCAVFGLIVAVGLSNLQHVDLNSPRNQFIIGFAIFNSMSIAGPGGYMTNQETNPFGTTNAAEIAYAIFSSPMIIAFLCSFPMDNTVAGTREERGLHVWDKIQPHDVNNDPEYVEVGSDILVKERVLASILSLTFLFFLCIGLFSSHWSCQDFPQLRILGIPCPWALSG